MVAACYPDYVKDYDDGAGVYTAYQYDLRSFVIGESEAFDFTVALGGVIDNKADRKVKVVMDNTLLSKDLSTLAEAGKYTPFTAIDAILGNGKFGTICQKYVTEEARAASLSVLTELPEAYRNVTGLDGLTIAKGKHTATARISLTDFAKEDSKMFAPYYAMGFQIVSADDADVPAERSFEVIMVKCEHKLFGSWSHEGSVTVQDMSGNDLYSHSFESSLADDKVVNLTTRSANSLNADKIENVSGKLVLTLNDDNTIKVESGDSYVIEALPGEPSYLTDSSKIEEREIFLNYKYTVSGSVHIVRDHLKFRSRVRDGVLEYEGENK